MLNSVTPCSEYRGEVEKIKILVENGVDCSIGDYDQRTVWMAMPIVPNRLCEVNSNHHAHETEIIVKSSFDWISIYCLPTQFFLAINSPILCIVFRQLIYLHQMEK